MVGLGPAGADLVPTSAAASCGRRPAGPSCARRATRRPRAFPGVPAFDHLYEAAATFEEVYAAIVEELVSAAARGGARAVVYAVPGSPLVAERTVELLRGDARVDVTSCPRSRSSTWPGSALGVDPLAEGVRLVDAGAFEARWAGGGRSAPGGAVLVADLLSEVKLSVPDDAGRRRPGRCSCTISASPTSRC